LAYHVFDHPLIQHKLSMLRDPKSPPKLFRELVYEITLLMAFEATRDLNLISGEIVTSMNVKCKINYLPAETLAVVPILRAGLGMVEAIVDLVPQAKVGHLGLYRDPKTLKPVTYYEKMPQDMDKRDVFIVDPMFATGGSLIETVNIVKGYSPRSIKSLCIIAAPEAVKKFEKIHSDVPLYCASIDEKLNEKGYILPGLGDAGDRLYGTK
jgi:uracil phosphoribosyltransferase